MDGRDSSDSVLLCRFVVPVSREDVETTDRSNVNVSGTLKDWMVAKSCQQGLKVVRCNVGRILVISLTIWDRFVDAHLRFEKSGCLEREEDWGQPRWAQ